MMTPRSSPPSSGDRGLRGCHRRGGQPDHVERAHQVDLDDAVEGLQRQDAVAAQHLAGGGDAGAVHHDPQRTQRRCGVDGGLHLVLVGHVRGNKDRSVPGPVSEPAGGPACSGTGVQFVGESRAGRGAEVREHHGCAGVEQPPGRGGAQAGRPARDQRDRTLDVHTSSLMWNRHRPRTLVSEC